MKNITTVVLLGILGLVAYKLVASGGLGGSTINLLGTGTASGTAGKAPAAASSGQSDYAATVAAISSIFGTVGTFINSSPKTN